MRLAFRRPRPKPLPALATATISSRYAGSARCRTPSSSDDDAPRSGPAGGDLTTLATLYDCHGAAAFALALRLVHDGPLAEAIVQRACLTVSDELRLRPMSSAPVRAHLLATVHHAVIERLWRGAGPDAVGLGARVLALADPPGPGPAPPLPDGAAIRAALATLPPDLRAVLELAYFDGLDYRQVAAQLLLSPAVVTQRMQKALGALATLLGIPGSTLPSRPASQGGRRR